MTAVAAAARPVPAMGDDPGFALYVHWPFCQAKCPYCDFNSHVRAAVDQDRWRAGLLAELDHFAKATPGRVLTSIFFGGGTPSLMAPETVGAVIDRARAAWVPAANLEITLEANPTSIEARRFAAYRAAGVNRVSVGVQALNDADLRRLGRQHSAGEARAALDIARDTFQRYSFDLIYARPGQTVAAWTAELDAALELAGDHLSVYQLTIEPGTRFAAEHARGDLVVPDEDTQAALFEHTADRLAEAGLPAYEISNHARPGDESRHNLTYWRYGDYVGIGPGAHGRLTLGGTKWATRTHRAPEVWLAGVETRGTAEKPREAITADQRLEEMLMMGLRLTQGVSLARIEAECGRPLDRWIDQRRLDPLVEHGFLTQTKGRLAATAPGRQRLNAVLAALLS